MTEISYNKLAIAGRLDDRGLRAYDASMDPDLVSITADEEISIFARFE